MSVRGVGFSFRPAFEGELSVDHLPDDFFARMERRVTDGLFVPGSRSRAKYRVCSSSRETLTFEAEDFLTAYNVGLNQVELRRTGPDSISYHVRFERWSRYAAIHGALYGVVMALVYLIPSVRLDVLGYRYGPQAFWGMLLFWSLGWPWIMTAGHRPFARRALERILRQELATDPRRRGPA